jgi:predicted DNA-binding transcriptional regulator AlpA
MEDDLLDVKQTCAFFGGQSTPIDASTLYRGIKDGRFPRPVKITKKLSRWRRSTLQAAKDKLIAASEAS